MRLTLSAAFLSLTMLCGIGSRFVSAADTPPAAGIERRLSEAERELRLAEVAERRVRERIAAIEREAAPDAEALRILEAYAHELTEIARIRRQHLEDLRNIAGQPVSAEALAVEQGMAVFDREVAEVSDAADPESALAKLDREFAASLDRFDAEIAAHHRKLETAMDARSVKAQQRASTHQTAAAEAEALLRSMGVDPGSGTEGENGGETVAASTPATTPPPAGSGSQTGGGRPGGAAGGGARTDEDVVARQLREAAEKETDPVLREKLWKEYEAYLQGRS